MRGTGELTMYEYIKRWVAIARLTYLEVTDGNATMADAKRVLADIPVADVVPVAHGRWEWLGPNRLVADCMCETCSACKVRSKYIVNTMICPNCCAKMDGGDDDATNGNV